MNFTTTCSGCGRKYTAHRHSKNGKQHCSRKCARKTRVGSLPTPAPYKHERGKPWKLDMAVIRKVDTLTVVSDPLPVERGGWKPGKKFTRDEWLGMYRHLTFTHGTILRDGRGRLYRADGSMA